MQWPIVFIIVSVVLFILAALPIPSKVNLGWAGAAFFAASFLLSRAA